LFFFGLKLYQLSHSYSLLLWRRYCYNSFIDSEKITTDTLDVNDRILLTNSFLLLHADKELIAKLKERGKVAVADIYISKYDKQNYDTSFKEFENTATQVQGLWKSFNDARGSLDKNLKRLESETTIKKHHKKMIESIKAKYAKYKDSTTSIDSKNRKASSKENLRKTKIDLDKYFEYESYEKAQKQYREKMEKTFGHFVLPTSWLDSSGYLTDASMKRCISSEIRKSAKKRGSLPVNLSAKQFFNQLKVKSEVAKQLKKDGILIPKDFNYSYAQFKKYYNIMSIKKYNKAPKQFYKKLKANIGKNDLKLSDDWNRFMRSKFIHSKISEKLPNSSKKDKQYHKSY